MIKAILIVVLILGLTSPVVANTPPVVSNVVAVQRPHIELVDISFDIVDADGDAVFVTLIYSLDGGVTWDNECYTVTGDVGPGVVPGLGLQATWDAGVDEPDYIHEQFVIRVYAEDDNGGGDGFISIPAGTFTMGSPVDEPGRVSDEVQHQVTLTNSIFMSPYVVTDALWDSVMGTGSSTSQLPKVSVSWYDALEFCNALSVQEGLTPAYSGSGTSWSWDPSANGYRLPTEAEWEYACRAGSATAFANGPITDVDCSDPNLDVMGWYCGNSGDQVHDVGGKQANSWGIYDMHGNIYEWCWDWHGSYPAGSATDPLGPVSGGEKILRGGSWSGTARYCRSAGPRSGDAPSSVFNYIGFRLVRSAE